MSPLQALVLEAGHLVDYTCGLVRAFYHTAHGAYNKVELVPQTARRRVNLNGARHRALVARV